MCFTGSKTKEEKGKKKKATHDINPAWNWT